MVQRLRDQCRGDFARRDLIWREQPPYRRILLQGSGARVAVMLLIAVLMGLEAASLRRWTLSRRRWRQLDVVVADDEDAAERRFFDRWMSGRGFGHQPMTDRGAPPPTRDLPGQPFARPPSAHGDIVGL